MFLDKNRDILRSDLIDLLNSSKNKVRNPMCLVFHREGSGGID